MKYEVAGEYCFTGHIQRNEIISACTESAAKLCIVGTPLARTRVRCLFAFLVLRYIIKRMVQCVCHPGLLCKQQDESKK